MLDSFFNRLGIQDPEERQKITAILLRAGVLDPIPQFQAPPQSGPTLAFLDPQTIHADPATYQFRSGGHFISGITQEHRIRAKRWDPVLHGDPLIVHERLDGTLFVADGHHRLDLAKHLRAHGNSPETVAAYVFREADGYTAKDMKIIAAYKNIQHGKTDPLDTARVFKEVQSGQVNHDLLPELDMHKGNLAMSYSLSKLPEFALKMVEKGEVPVAMAAAVPCWTSDPAQQESLMHTIHARLHQSYNIKSAEYDSHITAQVSHFERQEKTPGFLAKLQHERAASPAAGIAI